MLVSRLTDDGTYIFVNGWHELKPELDMFIRCMERLKMIQEITDLTELPEYLSDEDPRVVEAAILKLEQLLDKSNAR